MMSSIRHDVDQIMLNEAYVMQNDYSYYTNSTKKNVISVCVCVCHTLFQRVSSSFQFDFQILDSFQDVTSSRGQQGVHSSAANEDSCEYSVKQIETSICVPARFMKR